MTLSLNLLPVYQWTHREFNGEDPWAGGRPVTWSVVVYRMVGETFINAAPAAKQSVPSTSNRLPRMCVVGIFARTHNRYRILPLALQDLWREGKVADQDLPRLLHRVEGPLRISDYPPARFSMVLKAGTVAFAALSWFSCGGAFRDPNVNESLLVTTAVCASLSCFCFAADWYGRARRKRFARTWLRMIQDVV